MSILHCYDSKCGVLQDIAEGQRLLTVPLRLAIVDYADDPEAEAFGLTSAPWAVRLAVKLLRERAAGADSPWAPYIQVRWHFLCGQWTCETTQRMRGRLFVDLPSIQTSGSRCFSQLKTVQGGLQVVMTQTVCESLCAGAAGSGAAVERGGRGGQRVLAAGSGARAAVGDSGGVAPAAAGGRHRRRLAPRL